MAQFSRFFYQSLKSGTLKGLKLSSSSRLCLFRPL